MSIHPSLKGTDKSKKQRSVLKRIERIKLMAEKNEWKEGERVFGLPKIKTLKIKIKKEKAEKVEAAAGATPAEGAAAAAPAGKAPAGKAPAGKAAEKK